MTRRREGEEGERRRKGHMNILKGCIVKSGKVDRRGTENVRKRDRNGTNNKRTENGQRRDRKGTDRDRKGTEKTSGKGAGTNKP